MLFVGSCRDQFKHCLLFLMIILKCKKLEQVYNSIPDEFPLKLIAEQYKLKPKGSTRLVSHLKLQDKSTSGLKHYSVARVSLCSKLVSHFNAFGLSQLNLVNASDCLADTLYGINAQPSIAGPIPASSRYRGKGRRDEGYPHPIEPQVASYIILFLIFISKCLILCH